MAKSDVVFGEHKAVELKSYESHTHELTDLIEAKIGAHRHYDVDWSAVREKLAAAEKDAAMRDAHVKVGVIDGDLIWRAKADKFTGPKEYDAILVKHYTHLVSEYQRFLKENEANESEDETDDAPGPATTQTSRTAHTGGGTTPTSTPRPGKTGGSTTTTRATQVVDSSDDFKAKLAALKKMPGYFASLDADGAKAKLESLPAGSWLLRASSGGGVTWSRREAGGSQPVKHWRIANPTDYEDFHRFIEGKGKNRQVTS